MSTGRYQDGIINKYLPVELFVLYLAVDRLLCYTSDSMEDVTLFQGNTSQIGGINMAEKTEAQKKAQQKYMEKFVRVEVRMTPEKRDIIQDHAITVGMSLNAYINEAIDEKIERESCTAE